MNFEFKAINKLIIKKGEIDLIFSVIQFTYSI